MADLSTLITQIEETITTNGAQEITGAVLQTQLKAIINALNEAKVDAEDGKTLTTNDLTDTLLNLLNTAVQPAAMATAIATALASYVAKSDIVDTTGSNTDKVMSQSAITTLLALKVAYEDILEETGSNSDKVMSQKAITDALALLIPLSSIVETTGTSSDKVMSQKAITEILAGLETYNTYGVRHYYGNATPSLTRIGNLYLHQTLPVQSKMRRCILDDDGHVVYYLNEDNSVWREDGQAANLDGTDGQVMVEIPEHYRRCVVNSTEGYYDVEISLTAFEGAIRIPKYYISAFEASLDRTNNKLSSVRNLTEQYRGGTNQSGWDDTYRSLLGMPVTGISTNAFRTYAQNRGSRWGLYDINMHFDLFWLFAIEYGTLNSQATFNSDLDDDGYKQGGLGSGVTNINSTSWGNYNSYNPFIKCGYTLSLGNNTGVVEFSWDAEQEAAYGAAWTTYVPSYRGVENPFGHIAKWCDGFIGVGDGTGQKVYICRDRDHYASTLNEYYHYITEDVTANGYCKSIIRNEYGDLIATDDTGGSTTYFCDYHYHSSADGTIYGVYVGGDAYYGASAGFGYLYANYAFTVADANIGSRLCWSAENIG